MRRILRLIGLTGIILFLGLELIPHGREHPNPAITGEPEWDSAQTRALAVRACFDCHSNETRWPWYSFVAPMSWLVERDVLEGREELNFSEWKSGSDGDDAAETVLDGSMPPFSYEMLHPEARLSEDQKTRLVEGFDRTFGSDAGEDRDTR